MSPICLLNIQQTGVVKNPHPLVPLQWVHGVSYGTEDPNDVPQSIASCAGVDVGLKDTT